MKVAIQSVQDKAAERLVIECVAVTPTIERLRSYALTLDTTLTGNIGDRTYAFDLSDVSYFEAAGERVYAYTRTHAYELKIRLYELENAFRDRHFVRCSKSFVINLLRLDSIRPALNGRFTAYMKSGEKIIISRQYVPAVKQAVLGGRQDGP